MAYCRSCKQEIVWIKTRSGKSMPCDPETIEYNDAEHGAVLITLTGEMVKVDGEKSYPNVKGYQSHFSSCPDADSWRKTSIHK